MGLLQTTVSQIKGTKSCLVVLMCLSLVIFIFLYLPAQFWCVKDRYQLSNTVKTTVPTLFEVWGPPPPRWAPVQNKSEYVGGMAKANEPFLSLNSPRTKELLGGGNVNCREPWVTIPTSGQLGSNVMQTFFVYNLKYKYKIQAGMTKEMWNYIHDVFPYTHQRILPNECLEELKSIKRVHHNTIPKELQKKDGQRHFLIKPAYHAVVHLWYLRKVLIEEFRIADHIVAEARNVLEKLLDKWRQRMSTVEPPLLRQIEPRTVVGVHVRRTDKAKEIKKYFNTNLISPAYFHNAFATVRKMFNGVAFVVITDDIAWANQNLITVHPDAVIQDERGNRDVDLAIMSLCDHVITSTGNFGFLGAWLAGGMIFYPEATFTGDDKPLYFQRENAKTYYHFIAIPYIQTK